MPPPGFAAGAPVMFHGAVMQAPPALAGPAGAQGEVPAPSHGPAPTRGPVLSSAPTVGPRAQHDKVGARGAVGLRVARRALGPAGPTHCSALVRRI